MSNRRKNNHYHYAEKFDSSRRGRRGFTAYMPFKSVIISLVVLLMFGLLSTTFAVYVTDNEPEYDPAAESPAIVVQARNLKASRDIALTGANADLASTGATWSFSGTSYMYFDNSVTKWTDSYICLLIGKGTSGNTSYTSVYKMTKVTDTNYYYCQLPSSGWTDASYMAVIGTSSLWGSGEWGTSNLTNANHRTATYTSGLEASDTQRYTFTPSAAANGSLIALAYKGTGSAAMDEVTLTIKACYSNNGSSYTEGNTGGTVSIKGYKYSGATVSSSTTTSTAGATSELKVAKAAKTATFQYSTATGYRFEGFFTAKTGGSSASSTYTQSGGDKTVYARFIKRYTVTVQNMSGYTGTAPTGGGTVDAGTSVTISASTPTGVSFSGWTFSGSYSGGTASSASTTITPTSNVTATANYTLSSPTGLALAYPTVLLTNASSVSPTTNSAATATDSGSGSVLHYSYSIAQDSASTVSLTEGTDYSVDSNGVVSASYPGKYVVTMSVYDVAYGLTSTTATTTATVIVKPAAPDSITYVVNGFTDAASVTSTTGTTAADPYKIPIKSTAAGSTFSIRTLISEEDRVSGYIYRWSMSEGIYNYSTYAETAGSITPSYGTTTTSVADTTDEVKNSGTALHVTTAGYYYYAGSVVARYNGVDSDATPFKVYYTVITDFLNVDSYQFSNASNVESVHKIYAESNDITKINAVYDTGLSSLNTLFLFSNSNLDYTAKEAWTTGSFSYHGTTYSATPNDAAHRVSTPVDIFDIQSMMNYTGVKYFKSYVADTRTPSNVAAAEPMLHTTVGTTSSGGNHPFYFVDNTGRTLNGDTRLMAFFIDSSGNTLRYQTAQKLSSRTNTYRFYVPNDAVSVTFMYAASNYYVLPAAAGGVISYTQNSDIYKAMTDTITLSDYYGMNTFTATASEEILNNSVGTGIYKYTGTISTLN